MVIGFGVISYVMPNASTNLQDGTAGRRPRPRLFLPMLGLACLFLSAPLAAPASAAETIFSGEDMVVAARAFGCGLVMIAGPGGGEADLRFDLAFGTGRLRLVLSIDSRPSMTIRLTPRRADSRLGQMIIAAAGYRWRLILQDLSGQISRDLSPKKTGISEDRPAG